MRLDEKNVKKVSFPTESDERESIGLNRDRLKRDIYLLSDEIIDSFKQEKLIDHSLCRAKGPYTVKIWGIPHG